MNEDRIGRLRDLLDEKDGDLVLLTSTENLFYFFGLRGSWGEPSITLGLVTADEHILLTVPMEEERVEIETGISPDIVPKGKERTHFLVSTIERLPGVDTVLYDSLDAAAYREISDVFAETDSVETEIDRIRAEKDEHEIQTMKTAAEITVSALRRVPELLGTCETEADLAAELEYHLRKEGADGPAFDTIVASGSRSSLPHGWASTKAIDKDSIVLVDVGARYRGYCADFTRVFSNGEMSTELTGMTELTLQAFEEALDSVEPGVKASQVYDGAVGVFQEAGMEKRFLHSLGHGVGISVHEYPRLGTNEDRLLEGMVVTIEPGLYIPGVGGIRVEDTLCIGADGPRPLATLTREVL